MINLYYFSDTYEKAAKREAIQGNWRCIWEACQKLSKQLSLSSSTRLRTTINTTAVMKIARSVWSYYLLLVYRCKMYELINWLLKIILTKNLLQKQGNSFIQQSKFRKHFYFLLYTDQTYKLRNQTKQIVDKKSAQCWLCSSFIENTFCAFCRTKTENKKSKIINNKVDLMG